MNFTTKCFRINYCSHAQSCVLTFMYYRHQYFGSNTYMGQRLIPNVAACVPFPHSATSPFAFSSFAYIIGSSPNILAWELILNQAAFVVFSPFAVSLFICICRLLIMFLLGLQGLVDYNRRVPRTCRLFHQKKLAPRRCGLVLRSSQLFHRKCKLVRRTSRYDHRTNDLFIEQVRIFDEQVC